MAAPSSATAEVERRSGERHGGRHAAERLDATATVEIEPGKGVTTSHIEVRGRVANLDADGFGRRGAEREEQLPHLRRAGGHVELTVEHGLDT